MWFETKHVVLTAGVGTGISEVVAFDAALRAAGIADFNLIRVTSIVPPGVPVHRLGSGELPEAIAGEGLMLPTVYATAATKKVDTVVSAAVGVGLPLDQSRSGVIFPNNGEMQEEGCRNELRKFIAEGMKSLRRIDSYAVEMASASQAHKVQEEWSVAFAGLSFCDLELWSFFESFCRQGSEDRSR